MVPKWKDTLLKIVLVHIDANSSIMHDNLVQALIMLAQDNMARYSDMKSYHAAALVSKGNKVIAYGVNTPRSYLNGRSAFTTHAEEAALYSLFNKRMRHNKKYGWQLKVA